MALGERGRNPLAPRSTAEGACALRAAGALEDDPAVRCPDAMAAGFLGGFNITTLAKRSSTRRLLLAASNRTIPGAYTYEIARAKFIDEVLLAEVESGLDELVLLGAGLDSRPYRFARELQGVRVIEVDHPESQASKRQRLRRLLGTEPDHVVFLGIDFTRDDLGEALAAAGHVASARTLFLWSGVSMYLPGEAVADVLSWVAGQGSRSSIVFDALFAGAIDGSHEYFGAEKACKAVAERGEPWQWGIPEGRLEEALAGFGLRAERAVDAEEARATYLRRSDGSLHDPPYGFGLLIHARGTEAIQA